MVYRATREIAEKLKSHDFKYDIVETESSSRVVCGIGGKHISYKVQFISLDDDSDVAVRAFDLVTFPKAKEDAMIRFANECNRKYRYAKFVANLDDRTMQMEYDCTVSTVDPAESAFEILLRIMKMLDEMGDEMMRRVWC